MAREVINLLELAAGEVPADLKAETYFDFAAHPFAHKALFDESSSVCQAISKIGDYATAWLEKAVAELKGSKDAQVISAKDVDAQVLGEFEAIVSKGAVFAPRSVIGGKDRPGTIVVGPGASVVGCDLEVKKGSIYVGAGTSMEPGAGVKGPTIIGENCEIRQGSYLRGDCILGDDCTIRCEMKNAVVMNTGNFPHPSYLGDSLAGYMTHFGNQVTAANLGIYNGVRDKKDRTNLTLEIEGKVYDIGTPKMGVVMGDFCQVGCSSTTDPGTFLRPLTIAYTLTRITKGLYGPNEVLKNKPMEHGVVERSPLRPL